MIELSKRTRLVNSSPTLSMNNKIIKMKEEGIDVINLGIGESDFDTPKFIKNAAISAIKNGFTKYTQVDGITELKCAIQNKFIRDNNLYYSENQILVSAGSKQSIYNLCQVLIDKEDEVLIPKPYWSSYPDIVLLAGGKPIFIDTTIQDKFKIQDFQLNNLINDKTKLIFINSPSNPSGISYSLQELKKIGNVLRHYPNIWIATDDIYEYIIWKKSFFNIINACPELVERTIILNGVSKSYSMTGWRIGYSAGPKLIISEMNKIQSQSTSNPCSISQKASISALQAGKKNIINMIKIFKERHDYVIDFLKNIKDIEVIPSDGTFYIFPNFEKIIKKCGFSNDVEFTDVLLQEGKIALIPGSVFGMCGYIRLSLSVKLNIMKNALIRIKKFIECKTK